MKLSPSHARPSGASAERRPRASPADLARKARRLAASARAGTLSTLSAKRRGWPFGSVMPYGLDGRGRPTFLISSMAVHAKNLRSDPRASLLVTQPGAEAGALGAARLTLLGRVARVPARDLPAVRRGYLKAHPDARMWVGYGDFAFHRLEVLDVYLVGGFGVMGWVKPKDFLR